MKNLSLTAAVLCMWSAAVGAQNLVVNGSFESPVLPSTFPTMGTPTGWTGIVEIEHQPSYFGVPGMDSADGGQVIGFFPHSLGSGPSGISQVIHLDAGTTYTFSFDYSGVIETDRFSDLLNYSITAGSVTTLSAALHTMLTIEGSPWRTFSTSFSASVSGPETLYLLNQEGAKSALTE